MCLSRHMVCLECRHLTKHPEDFVGVRRANIDLEDGCISMEIYFAVLSETMPTIHQMRYIRKWLSFAVCVPRGRMHDQYLRLTV